MAWISNIARRFVECVIEGSLYMSDRHITEEVEKLWSTFDRNNDGYITWEEYKDRKYGMISTANKNSRVAEVYML